MLPHLLVLFLWLPSLIGWGLVTQDVLLRGLERNVDVDRAFNPGVTTLIGLLPLTILATLLHFFLPLTASAAICALVVGYGALFVSRRSLIGKVSAPSIAFAVFSMSAVALFASKPLTHFDTGLYHIQMAKWCSMYPLVRGLANLHERLAFNSLWTPLSALLNWPRFGDCACYPVTCLLVTGFGWAAGHTILRELRSVEPASVFLGTCGCFWASVVVSNITLMVLPSLSTDAPAYFMTLLCIYFLLRYSHRARINDLLFAMIVSAMALVFKLSTAPLFGFLVAFGAFTLWRDPAPLARKIQVWLPTLAAVGALLTLWVGRSILLSGYLVFPIPATALTFLPWHYPVAMGTEAARWIEAWARHPKSSPDAVLGNWHWLNGWAAEWTMENLFFTTLVLGVFGALVLFVRQLRKGRSTELPPMWPAAAMTLAGVVFWFVTAPAPRFGYAYVFGLAAIVFAFGIGVLLRERIGLLRIVLTALIVIALTGANDTSHFHLTELPRVGSTDGAIRKTDQGLFVWVPAGDGCVMNGPLPSTPYFRPSLIARVDAKRRIVEFKLPER